MEYRIEKVVRSRAGPWTYEVQVLVDGIRGWQTLKPWVDGLANFRSKINFTNTCEALEALAKEHANTEDKEVFWLKHGERVDLPEFPKYLGKLKDV